MKLSNVQKVFCDEVYSNTNVDLAYILETQEIENIEALYEYVYENNLTYEEVIYYADAMDYLKEHDQSLTESIEIAFEMGYELESINSEILASLLKSKNNREDFEEYREDIEKIIF